MLLPRLGCIGTITADGSLVRSSEPLTSASRSAGIASVSHWTRQRKLLFSCFCIWIFLLISFLDCSLIIQRNIIGFCVWILHSAALLKSFGFLCMWIFRVFYIQGHVICEQGEFFCFPCPVTLARASSAVLRTVVREPVSFPHPGGRAFSLSRSSVACAVGFTSKL